ncbi:hypothetical protein OO013_07855 [Mangrovivirga sp. M17]|uniref:Lipoprotein n=1 Tax=Mangrovivirga halotolerans TaxID=2993936 RepID=A0ABT3RPQ4_9BACT|nr:hypothetical protein [Mangrovivirga halotolerans]MCX2743774.1 hypothetical protein [Mangrovivirga halotolerans]
MNNKKFTKLILTTISFCSLFLNSCVKENCQGFPKENLIYIPYQIDDTLIFENGSDTITFRIVDSGITEPYTIKTSFPATTNEECHYYAFFKSSKENTYGYTIEDGYHDHHRVTFSINDHQDVYEMLNTNTYSNAQELGSVTINGINYDNVYLMEKDTNIHKAGIIKILKAPYQGIIQFIDHSNGFTWNRIN